MGIPGGIASSLEEFGFLSDAWGLPARRAGAFLQELIVPGAAKQAEQHSRRTCSGRIKINL